MNEMILSGWVQYIMPLVAGMAISLLYHAGLWWTVRSLPRSRRPVILSVGSFYVRMTITMAGFYVVMQNDWRRLVTSLAGFIIMKCVMIRIMENAPKSPLGNRRIQ